MSKKQQRNADMLGEFFEQTLLNYNEEINDLKLTKPVADRGNLTTSKQIQMETKNNTDAKKAAGFDLIKVKCC